MSALAAFLLLLAAPAAAQSSRQVGATMCACPSGGHKPLGSAPSCEVACYGAAPGGGAGSGPSAGAQLGQAIGAGIVDMMKQSDAAKAQRARQALIDAQRQQEQRRVEDEARKDRLLSGMQGVEGGETLTLMLGDEPVPETRSAIAGRAQDLHNKEAALRRAALERLAGKPEAAWCKLHLPQALAMPQRSTNDDRLYSGQLRKFARDRADWDKRCGGPSAGGPTPLDKDLAALQRVDAPKLVPVAALAAAPAMAPAAAAVPALQPAAAPAAPPLQAGGLALMTDDDLPRAAPRKEPAPAAAPPAPPSAPAGEPQPKGWTAVEAEAQAPHVVEAGAPGMPPPAAAPVFPAAPSAPKEARAAFARGSASAAPGAYAFMSRAAAPARERATEKPKYELGAIFNGVSLAASSIKVLYNLGAASSESVESETLLVYGKDETEKGAFEPEKGIAILPAGSVEWKDLTAESAGPNRWLRADETAGAKR